MHRSHHRRTYYSATLFLMSGLLRAYPSESQWWSTTLLLPTLSSRQPDPDCTTAGTADFCYPQAADASDRSRRSQRAIPHLAENLAAALAAPVRDVAHLR